MSYTFALEDAYFEGERKGELRGILKGKLEGKIEGKIETARNLLDILDDATIAQKTGFPIEKIEELRREAFGLLN